MIFQAEIVFHLGNPPASTLSALRREKNCTSYLDSAAAGQGTARLLSSMQQWPAPKGTEIPRQSPFMGQGVTEQGRQK